VVVVLRFDCMLKQLDSNIFYFDFVENSFDYILTNVFVPKEIRKGRKEGIFEGKKINF
jgi:hypothetical protein